MLFAPIAGKLTQNLTNTVTNMGDDPTHTPGYNFWGYEIDNTLNATNIYLQLFDVPASQVILGSTTPKLVFAVTPSSARGFGFGPPIIFKSGLSAAVTTTKSGSSAIGTPVDVTIYFEEK